MGENHIHCRYGVSLRSLLAATGTTLGALAAISAFPGATAMAQNPAGRMPIRRDIPKTGEQLPVVGLGTFETFDVTPGEPRGHVREVLRRFHAAGGRVVDSSPLYGMSEVSVGDFATELGFADDLFITNKTWTTGEWLSDNSHSEAQFQRTMERLWRKSIDVQQVHSLENFDQVLHLLRKWKAEGRVRYIGATQWSPEYYDTLERLVRAGGLDFIQVNYSIASRRCEERLLPACVDNGVAVQINMPFEKARLFPLVDAQPLPDFAKEFDAANWAQFFLKFIIANPAVISVIPATSVPEHVTENMAHSTAISPTRPCWPAWSSIWRACAASTGSPGSRPIPAKNTVAWSPGRSAKWPFVMHVRENFCRYDGKI